MFYKGNVIVNKNNKETLCQHYVNNYLLSKYYTTIYKK